MSYSQESGILQMPLHDWTSLDLIGLKYAEVPETKVPDSKTKQKPDSKTEYSRNSKPCSKCHKSIPGTGLMPPHYTMHFKCAFGQNTFKK